MENISCTVRCHPEAQLFTRRKRSSRMYLHKNCSNYVIYLLANSGHGQTKTSTNFFDTLSYVGLMLCYPLYIVWRDHVRHKSSYDWFEKRDIIYRNMRGKYWLREVMGTCFVPRWSLWYRITCCINKWFLLMAVMVKNVIVPIGYDQGGCKSTKIIQRLE